MDTARISALLEPFLEAELPAIQLDQISTYIDLLLHWNARINLTAIRKPDEIVTRHFGESLFMARHLFPLGAQPAVPSGATAQEQIPVAPLRVIDLGSGAGFPALPLKIWAPQIQLVLIESNHKKVTFLREVFRALKLTTVDVIAERAEIVSARLGPEFPQADIVTFRAVEEFDQVLPVASTFLLPKSRLALLIGESQLPKLNTSHTLLNCEAIPIPKSHSRVLAICALHQSGKNSQGSAETKE